MDEQLLILNAGSSSVKFSLFTAGPEPRQLVRGAVESLGERAYYSVADPGGRALDEHRWAGPIEHADAVEFILSRGARGDLGTGRIAAAGHRVVHGGATHAGPQRVTPALLHDLKALLPLAPLHQPHNLIAINAVARLAPGLPQVACFDTAFHQGQPRVARTIALPRRLTERGVVRYGFHGLSYEHIASVLPSLDARAAAGRTIVAHLGNGASLCAMHRCRSVATTMGFSVLDGLVMGTRCGTIDPGAVLYVMQHEGLGVAETTRLLHEECGLLGVSGVSGDMRTLLKAHDPRCREAIELFVYRAALEVGSMAAALGGVDAIVFTGGIGEHATQVREEICRASAWLGLELDAAASVTEGGQARLSTVQSRVSAWVIPANEELVIARHTMAVLGV